MTGNIAPKGFSEETMKEKRMRIKYRLGGRVYEDDLYQNEHYVIDEQAGDDGIKTVITPKVKLELISFSCKDMLPGSATTAHTGPDK